MKVKARSDHGVRGSQGQGGREEGTGLEMKEDIFSLRIDACAQLPASPHPTFTSFDVANEVGGDVLVVDTARSLVQHDISDSWGLPMGRRMGTKWETK